MNRDNIPRRPNLRMRSECRGINLKIPLTLSDSQVIGNVIGCDKNEFNGDNRDKENFPPVRRSIPNISFILCERERVNIGKAK